MSENYNIIGQGFRHLLAALGPYVCSALKAEFGDRWWTDAVLGRFYEEQKRDLPVSGSDEQLLSLLDIQRVLILLDLHWRDIFRRRLSASHRNWAKELLILRNRHSHIGAPDLSADETWRGLDTMTRLCEDLDSEKTEEIRSLMRKTRYGTQAGSTSIVLTKTPPVKNAGLRPWREIIQPHPDVAEGRYRNAEFAADLIQVSEGEGAVEYRDPVEFFARTYVTEGMKGLLLEALARVSQRGGQPVIQLKTAFGGGKTHSMLALYHLLRGRAPLAKIPAIQTLLAQAGISAVPKAHVVVLVGTSLDPSRPRKPDNLPGVTVNTLWGEIAAQLAVSTGRPELYEHVRLADKKGISPGSIALKKLLDDAGSALILIDEMIAYARKLYGQEKLPAGSFDNFLTFIQELTEAARASKSSLIVASLPESDIEIGGQAGQLALAAIEHTFGRMESVWKPVDAHEGFEVVRRRLFLDCGDPEGRDRVCKAFSAMYEANPADFPGYAREADYRKRIADSYPIHPEIFDRLYDDWSTLEHFQRTRGVLRLMAAVISELWLNNDQSLLIQPGNLPLHSPAVRDELIRRLPDNWNGIVDSEVDGVNSEPYKQDKSNTRYGKCQASRRLARTIMLGSAPTVREQRVRGLEAASIRLGVAAPDDQISVYNDALTALRDSLAHLYVSQSGDRYWYDTRPTLRRIAAERARKQSQQDVEDELEEQLIRYCKKNPLFCGMHVCPPSSLDVPDDQAARLVVLRPRDPWSAQEDCAAELAATAILERHGNPARIYRNMLIFLAPDRGELKALEQGVREYLAWQSIWDDKKSLNLDQNQSEEVEASLRSSQQTIRLRIDETWIRLLIPSTDRDEMKKQKWLAYRTSGKGEDIITKAVRELNNGEQIITRWSPGPLLMELNKLLWTKSEHLEIARLWNYLTTYCYLPRLRNYDVLKNAIAQGVEEGAFGYAAAPGEDGYLGLKLGQTAQIDQSGYIVKKEIAESQLEKEREALWPDAAGSAGSRARPAAGQGSRPEPVAEPEPEPVYTRFFMSARLDSTRVNRDVNRIVEEVLNHLSEDGSIEIHLEVQATAPEGFQKQTMQTARENCRTLKIENFGFEQD